MHIQDCILLYPICTGLQVYTYENSHSTCASPRSGYPVCHALTSCRSVVPIRPYCTHHDAFRHPCLHLCNLVAILVRIWVAGTRKSIVNGHPFLRDSCTELYCPRHRVAWQQFQGAAAFVHLPSKPHSFHFPSYLCTSLCLLQAETCSSSCCLWCY